MVRLTIFEDNDSLRNSLVKLLNSRDDFRVIGAYPNALNVYQNVLQTTPDVVILDINMPIKNGIAAIPVIKEIDARISVIMYTQFEDDDKIYKSICAGADGYILKKSPPYKLFEAIEEVKSGGAPLTSGVAKKILTYFQVKQKPISSEFDLTKREKEVLHYLVKGYSIKHIAEELFIAFDTARSHLRSIYKKLHVNCGKEAIAKILAERKF